MKRRYFLFVFYFLLGVSGSIYHFSMRKDLQRYHISLSDTNYYLVLPHLPWAVKCVFATISESFPIYGYSRKPYLILSNILGFTFSLLLIVHDTLPQFIGLFLGQQIFAAWADVMYDSLMIEEGNLESSENEGRLQIRIQLVRTLGRVLGRSLGPVLWEAVTSDGVYGLMSLCFLLSLLLSLCVKDLIINRVDTRPRSRNKSCRFCATYYVIIRDSLYHPVFRVLLAFNVVSGLTPSSGTPTFFFINDVVGMTPLQISLLAFTAEMAQLFMILLFDLWLLKFKIRTIYIIVCVLKVIAGCLPYFLVARADDDYKGTCIRVVNETSYNDTCYYFEQHNLDPFPLAMGDNVVGEALEELQSMPLSVITKTICYHQLGATVYTLTLALQNAVGGFNSYLNSKWMTLFHIDHGNFTALPEFVKFCTGVDAASMFFIIFFLPYKTLTEIREQVELEKKRVIVEIGDEFQLVPVSSTTTESVKTITL